MADVKWIKLAVSLPDNKKIKRIRKLPDGNNIILFWVFLLSRAGESNEKGGLFFTENVPYSEEDLAADFDFTTEFVRFAVITLEKYRMIELYDSIIFIKNWDEYQQMDKLEKIQEQNRIRQANYREKQQEIANSNVTVTLPVTQSNAIELELELELELEREKDIHRKRLGAPKQVPADLLFDEIWKLYPKKVDKKGAIAAFKKAIKKGVEVTTVKKGVEQYVKHLETNKDWLKPMDGGRWFQKERWSDELAEDETTKGPNDYESKLGF